MHALPQVNANLSWCGKSVLPDFDRGKSQMGMWLIGGLQLVQSELMLFAAFWLAIGAFDEMVVDGVWLWLFASGRTGAQDLPAGYELRPLTGSIAVMVAAWHEPQVIGEMIGHTLAAWSQSRLTLYVGCYCNDAATLGAAMAGAPRDVRLRIVIHDRPGPTTKADCLNRVYRAIHDDERRLGVPYVGVVMHDAEDMVHPAALALMDYTLERADFVQLPVRPEPQVRSPWVAGHYTDEFTEAHAKTLVVRDALGAAIPSAGVGFGVSRAALGRLAEYRAAQGFDDGPFEPGCLTEDYELGLLLTRLGGRGRFVRARDSAGALVATRAFFPCTVRDAVRQKTRWIHGIALQCWDRLGWPEKAVDKWMVLRDRRGPLLAIVLAAAYLLVLIEGVLLLAQLAGLPVKWGYSPIRSALLVVSLLGSIWRILWRLAFTTHEYGLGEGLRAIVRVPVANIIAILAGRRAVLAYMGTLRGRALQWDKTEHNSHPAASKPGASIR
jgi:adsorption protein B